MLEPGVGFLEQVAVGGSRLVQVERGVFPAELHEPLGVEPMPRLGGLPRARVAVPEPRIPVGDIGDGLRQPRLDVRDLVEVRSDLRVPVLPHRSDDLTKPKGQTMITPSRLQGHELVDLIDRLVHGPLRLEVLDLILGEVEVLRCERLEDEKSEHEAEGETNDDVLVVRPLAAKRPERDVVVLETVFEHSPLRICGIVDPELLHESIEVELLDPLDLRIPRSRDLGTLHEQRLDLGDEERLGLDVEALELALHLQLVRVTRRGCGGRSSGRGGRLRGIRCAERCDRTGARPRCASRGCEHGPGTVRPIPRTLVPSRQERGLVGLALGAELVAGRRRRRRDGRELGSCGRRDRVDLAAEELTMELGVLLGLPAVDVAAEEDLLDRGRKRDLDDSDRAEVSNGEVPVLLPEARVRDPDHPVQRVDDRERDERTEAAGDEVLHDLRELVDKPHDEAREPEEVVEEDDGEQETPGEEDGPPSRRDLLIDASAELEGIDSPHLGRVVLIGFHSCLSPDSIGTADMAGYRFSRVIAENPSAISFFP